MEYTGTFYLYTIASNEVYGFQGMEISLDELKSDEWVTVRLVGKFEGRLIGELAEQLARERRVFYMGEG